MESKLIRQDDGNSLIEQQFAVVSFDYAIDLRENKALQSW